MGTSPDMNSDCPFPDVAESLRPYIKPREELLQTRQALQTHLPLSSLNVAQPIPLERINTSSLGGVRKAYWRALQAHNAAQAKYHALKTELTQIKSESSSLADGADSAAFLTESYVPLMRQRERRRKLAVLETTFARAKSCGGDMIGESFDKVAKREVGELPGPPSTSAFPDHESGSGSDYDLHKLKKAIVAVKQQLDQHQSRANEMNGTAAEQVNPHADLRGLQKAHIELTTWMETQLAIISDIEPPKENETNGSASPRSTNDGAQFSVRDIEALYDQYLDARERLLHLVAHPPEQPQDGAETSEGAQRGTDLLDIDQQATASEILLPHLSKLLSSKQQEQSLLQQGAYSRRQISSAQSQYQAIVARLADESHLVQPVLGRAAPRGRDWAKAAADAGAATFKSSTQRLKAGQASTDAAEKALDTIKSMPGSVDTLL